jgi:hypothetical protein
MRARLAPVVRLFPLVESGASWWVRLLDGDLTLP